MADICAGEIWIFSKQSVMKIYNLTDSL